MCGCRERMDVARQRVVLCGHAALQDGSTALVWAAERGHTDLVELLLDRGADLEAKGRVSAVNTCLCCATGPRRASRAGRGSRRRCGVEASCSCSCAVGGGVAGVCKSGVAGCREAS